MKRVWVIYSRKNPSTPMDKATPLPDEGFFLYGGDAQHHCNVMNAPTMDAYKDYCERYRVSKEEMNEEYATKKRAYDILVAAGEVPFFSEPSPPSLLPLLSFDQWWEGRDFSMADPVALNLNE